MDRPVHIEWLDNAGKVVIWIGLLIAGGVFLIHLGTEDAKLSNYRGIFMGLGILLVGFLLRKISKITFWWSIHIPEAFSNPPPGNETAGKTAPLRPKPTPVLYEAKSIPKE